jgi:alginate O-acetyltransferase complex protein AlgI
MLFPTVTFAVFFVVVFVAYWLTRGRPPAWKWVLLGASWVFYAWWDWRFVFLLAGSITLNHLVAGAMARFGPRPWLAIGVVANMAVLGLFKYYNFFLATLVELTQRLGWSPPQAGLQVLLPIGISFFTFEAIAYLIEVGQGKVSRLRLLDLAVYMSFFPKLTSGPITRASEFAPQLAAPADRSIEASTALWLIARGLFKKMVLATYLADAVTSGVFAAPGQYAGLEVLIGMYAYTVEIYLDFSAYTDMAIGLALLLGYRLPENFDRPYARITVTAFWAHWHMTLTRWLRDFVFTPLVSRGRVTTERTMWSLFLVMVIIGIWHGAGWNFMVFGAIHGVVIALERLSRVRRRAAGRSPAPRHPVARAARWLLTFHVVVLGWVFFRAGSVAGALEVLGGLLSPGPVAISPMVPLIIVVTLAVQLLPMTATDRLRAWFATLRPAAQAAALGVVLLVVDALGPVGVPPFIYFRF